MSSQDLPSTTPVSTPFLRYLETVTVPASDGTETIPGLSASGGQPTVATSAALYEQVANGRHPQLFGGLGENRLRWTRSQVARFATDHPYELRGVGNVFELEDGTVADVCVRGHGQPYADVFPFNGDVWDALCRLRVFSLLVVR